MRSKTQIEHENERLQAELDSTRRIVDLMRNEKVSRQFGHQVALPLRWGEGEKDEVQQ